MATISNTPRPGYVWDSTDNVWYPIGVGGHGHSDYITQATAVNPTIIDAKGDIITATAADTPARLAVGNNGESLVADSSASTGLKYAKAPNWHGARVYKSGTQTITNNTQTTLTFDAELYDTDNYHSNITNNNRLTIPTGLGGVYYVRARAQFDSNSTGARYLILAVDGDTSGQYDSYVVYQAVNGAETMIDINTIISLSAGSYVQAFVIQVSGGSLTNNVGAAIYKTDFSLNLIGL
jgi:hypothetical protein